MGQGLVLTSAYRAKKRKRKRKRSVIIKDFSYDHPLPFHQILVISLLPALLTGRKLLPQRSSFILFYHSWIVAQQLLNCDLPPASNGIEATFQWGTHALNFKSINLDQCDFKIHTEMKVINALSGLSG